MRHERVCQSEHRDEVTTSKAAVDDDGETAAVRGSLCRRATNSDRRMSAGTPGEDIVTATAPTTTRQSGGAIPLERPR